jgi:hypothetical protein
MREQVALRHGADVRLGHGSSRMLVVVETTVRERQDPYQIQLGASF